MLRDVSLTKPKSVIPFSQPSWMPSPSVPAAEFNEEDITFDEIRLPPSHLIHRLMISLTQCLKKLPISSSCSPQPVESVFDMPFCLEAGSGQAYWQICCRNRSITAKQLQANSSHPLCWEAIFYHSYYMLTNKYFDRHIQKTFMPVTAGCTEHHLKLTTILNDARKKRRSLAVCWMDLANAYGSVHHSLIMYSLQHYHAPPRFTSLIKVFYSGLAARVGCSLVNQPYFGGRNTSGHTRTALRAGRNVGLCNARYNLTTSMQSTQSICISLTCSSNRGNSRQRWTN